VGRFINKQNIFLRWLNKYFGKVMSLKTRFSYPKETGTLKETVKALLDVRKYLDDYFVEGTDNLFIENPNYYSLSKNCRFLNSSLNVSSDSFLEMGYTEKNNLMQKLLKEDFAIKTKGYREVIMRNHFSHDRHHIELELLNKSQSRFFDCLKTLVYFQDSENFQLNVNLEYIHGDHFITKENEKDLREWKEKITKTIKKGRFKVL